MNRRLGWLVPRLEKGEARLVVSLSLLHFLVILSFTLARITRDGVLLSRLPVRFLPYVSLGLAVWMALASAGFGRLARGVASHKALVRALVLTGVSLVAFSVWFRRGDRAAAIAFYLWVGAYGVLLVSQFWVLANERVNPRQARRLFGWIGTGGILGGMVAGAAASLVARGLSPSDLLLVIAGLHLVAVVLSHVSGVRAEERAPDHDPSGTEENIATFLRMPYVRLVALLFFAGGLTSGVLDYQFKYALQARSADPGRIAAVLGLFYGAQNLLALVIQLGLTGLLLSRFGVRGASGFLPGGLFLGSVASAMAPSFGAVLGSRLYDGTLRVSLFRTTSEFLFFPMAERVRRASKRFVDTVVGRSAEAAAGLLVLAVNVLLGGTVFQLALVVGVLSAAWLLVERLVDRAYVDEVSGSLDRMLVGARSRGVSLQEAGAAEELLRLLTPFDLEGETGGRLGAAGVDDPEPETRRAAYRSLGQAAERESIPFLAGRLAWVRDRKEAGDALASYGERAVGTLGDFLLDPHVPLRVRRAIPRVLAQIGGQHALHELLRTRDCRDDAVLRQRTSWAMTRIRKTDPRVVVAPALVDRQLYAEVAAYLLLLVQRAAAARADGPAGVLLGRALTERIAQSRERIFRGLALAYAPREMLRAHRGLVSTSARIRALSMEYLDTTLSAEHRALLAPLLDDASDDVRARSAAGRLGRPVPTPATVVGELLDADDRWLRTCALFAVGALRLGELAARIPPDDVPADAVLRETALWARRQLEEVP